MSCLRYLCLFVYSGVHTYCVVLCFALFVFVLCTLCCHFLWVAHFLYFLKFIDKSGDYIVLGYVTGATSGGGTVYPSGAYEFNLCF
jgi:hypothetical protein